MGVYRISKSAYIATFGCGEKCDGKTKSNQNPIPNFLLTSGNWSKDWKFPNLSRQPNGGLSKFYSKVETFNSKKKKTQTKIVSYNFSWSRWSDRWS